MDRRGYSGLRTQGEQVRQTLPDSVGAGLMTSHAWYSYSIDGQAWAYADAYSPQLELDSLLIDLPGLEYGSHELSLRNSRDVNSINGRDSTLLVSCRALR
jgi:hypothetical protein